MLARTIFRADTFLRLILFVAGKANKKHFSYCSRALCDEFLQVLESDEQSGFR